MLQPTVTLAEKIMASASSTASAPLTGNGTVQVGLFSSISGVPSPKTTLANLTEVSFDGYARQTVGSVMGPYVDQAGNVDLDLYANAGAPLAFTASPTLGSATTAMGYFLATTAGSPVLLGFEFFSGPVTINTPSQVVQVIPNVSFNPNNAFGQVIVIA
jgi:hypothetical protein